MDQLEKKGKSFWGIPFTQVSEFGNARRSGWGRRFRLPEAAQKQELTGETACPTPALYRHIFQPFT